jgi:hypothetical protein
MQFAASLCCKLGKKVLDKACWLIHALKTVTESAETTKPGQQKH